MPRKKKIQSNQEVTQNKNTSIQPPQNLIPSSGENIINLSDFEKKNVYIHFNLLTNFGLAANNRGETKGNTTTLQTVVVEDGSLRTIVSSEAIRFALRKNLSRTFPKLCNRYIDENDQIQWRDPKFETPNKFIDNDILGYMFLDRETDEKIRKTRKSPLEINYAISLIPYDDLTIHNFASANASPAANKNPEKINPTPYSTKAHVTSYQFGGCLSVCDLKVPVSDRKKYIKTILTELVRLNHVGGNHTRHLYDFSAVSAVFRVTSDPAPRILYCFYTDSFHSYNPKISPKILQRIKLKNIPTNGLYVCGEIIENLDENEKEILKNATIQGSIEETIDQIVENTFKELEN